MGGGNGGGLAGRGGASSVASNLKDLKSMYPISDSGYFGKASSKGNVRFIKSDNPQADAQKFFSVLAKDGKLTGAKKAGVTVVKFKDGTVVTYRIKSHSDGSPVVSITLSSTQNGVKSNQKIHFVSKGKND